MYNFVIAIMSHQRPSGLCSKTLKYIYENVKKPTDLNINVFLSDDQQKNDYQNEFNKIWGDKYGKTINFIVSGNSYKEKVNDIHFHFPVGQNVFVIEDDIIELSKMHIVDNKKKYKKITKLDEFIKTGFKKCREKNSNIFGIYPVYNAYFAYDTITDDFRFLIANAFGFISTHDNDLVLVLDAKSDYERTIKYMLKDNKVLRFNNVSPKTNNYGNTGGFGISEKRYHNERKSCDYLLKMYPKMVREKKCKSIYPEISLIKNFADINKIKELDLEKNKENKIKKHKSKKNLKKKNSSKKEQSKK